MAPAIVLIILLIATLANGWMSRREYIAGRHVAGDVFAAGSILCAGLFGAGMVVQSCG